MIKFAQDILTNKPAYLESLNYLDNKYNNIFFKKLDKEKDEINILSLFCEMTFGYILNQLFNDVKYEQKINGKTPDWLVNSNNQEILFEVKKINPKEDNLKEIIDSFKDDKYKPNIFSIQSNDFSSQYSKVIEKEVKYRELIKSENYILIICIDAVSLPNFITNNDLKESFNFKKPDYSLKKHQKFCENVAGILGRAKFPQNPLFIENISSKYGLNRQNLDIINGLNK
ncbi:hypothetical protein D1631_11345 [Chryseobacterium nematophagum]|uniref:Uncharacterized protein n=1 Tax=Chryseobacterium nematophagum TaxID=2305228 RepID=A0A3M7TG53_9FLAO|nr:hypothetical protein [Chryseobacterium nematophagum]RNA62485.1 hypothetical protein D1631_11345 [Chryseobacterium nematophagum]